MSRSKHARSKNKVYTKRFLIFFAVGLAIGALGFIFYKIYTRPVYRIVKKPPVYPKKISQPEVAHYKVAIVLDDFGYNYKNVETVMELKKPVTFSILPHLPYSKTISERAHQEGDEAILHLPLEPQEKEKYVRPEVNTITTAMKQGEVLERLTKALETTPFVNGVSNHQGSKATENAVLMRTIFTELKKRNLFFLDSLVSNKSVCKRIAKETGIRFGRRDVFLDNKEDFEYISRQMQQLIKRAKQNGYAIGIGHDREKTVAALSKLMPEAEKAGIEFVFLSELIK